MTTIQEEVRELLTGREAQGMATYGKPLTVYDGRCSLTDAIEEAADLTTYLVKARREQEELGAILARLVAQVPPVEIPGATTLPISYRDMLELRTWVLKSQGVTA